MPDLHHVEPGWYCFKALPKKEHIAARLLGQLPEVSAFCPRISYLKNTKRGKVRFVECLFPGYVFVEADLQSAYRQIRSVQGIRDVVAFGERMPRIPESFIADLQARVNEESLCQVPEPDFAPGQEVMITEGPFRNWRAIVTGSVDARQRVALLLEFLGRQMEIQMETSTLLPEGEKPKQRLWGQGD